jgi:hypothetical protein
VNYADQTMSIKTLKGDAMSDPADPTEKYDKMVSAALKRLTQWAFPDSQTERKNKLTWQLWHLTDKNEKYVDVEVELRMKKSKPDSFLISQSVQPQEADLSREDLDDALRIAICSLPE